MNGTHILLFGAGRSSAALINYLKHQVVIHSWNLTVADSDLQAARDKVRDAPGCNPVAADVNDAASRGQLISAADLVISLLPPSLHYLVAGDCTRYKRHLLTASYADEQIRILEKDVASSGLLFLCEMGLDPGIDHMSAMQLINDIKGRQGRIVSFKSHCGGLVAPESDDNPWHYKISWNAANVVKAGSTGAAFREDYAAKKYSYAEVFSRFRETDVEGAGTFAWYPNRNSLQYMDAYELRDVKDFMRTTLRHPDFCKAWSCIVQSGLTDDQKKISHGTNFREWSLPVLSCMNEETRRPLEFLGLFEETPIPANLETSAQVLQYLLEKKLMLQKHDRDMVVMQHELEYERHGRMHSVKSSLVLKGDDQINTAMARTVGLPLGIAAVFILQGKITLKGLHIPVLPEIYKPVLTALEGEGIAFTETHEVLA